MNQIAIGDPISGFTVLDGQSIAAPYIKAIIHFKFSGEPFVQEEIDLQLKGTSSQISGALTTLETIIQRALLYENIGYSSPQYLRFQLTAGGAYYYTPITNIYLVANPAGYLTQQTGSKVISIHYTRPNYFDGPKTQLPLTGRAGTRNPPNSYPLYNHTDSGTNHGSTVLIDPTDFATDLPAPLRIEYFFATPPSATLKDLFTGIFHHPTYDADTPFFAYYNNLLGGTSNASAAAIQGYYDRFTWTASTFAYITTYLIDTAYIPYFNGQTFRPIIHLFNTHAYSDLYLKVQIERYGEVLFVSEPVYSTPGYGYIILPPVEIPPNYLLREVVPERLQVVLYGYRTSAAAVTLDIDCLTIFPLTYAATFYGFIDTVYNYTIIDDSFRDRYNIRVSPSIGETVSHARVGGPLLLYPNSHSRIFFYCSDNLNLMPIAHIADLKVFYYPRLRLL
jgi:hypothetical protein